MPPTKPPERAEEVGTHIDEAEDDDVPLRV